MAAVAHAAARYAHGGYFTVVEGIVSPRWFFPPVRAALVADGLQVAYAILRPSLPVAVQRARMRPSSPLSQPSVIEQLWHDFAHLDSALERHVIDNTDHIPEETAEALAGQLYRGALLV